MKRKLDMLAFLQTGTIDGVTVGHTRRAVYEHLGRPDTHDPQDPIWRWNIWTYGGLEFHFTRDNHAHILWLIWSDHLPLQSPGHSSVELYPWRLGTHPIVWADHIMDGLTNEGIHFTRTDNIAPELLDVARLNLDSNVELGVGEYQGREYITHISHKWS